MAHLYVDQHICSAAFCYVFVPLGPQQFFIDYMKFQPDCDQTIVMFCTVIVVIIGFIILLSVESIFVSCSCTHIIVLVAETSKVLF